MKRISIMAIVATAIWALLAVKGYGFVDGVRAQQVTGYPNDGQVNYYIIVPSLVAIAASGAGICIWLGRFKVEAYTAMAIVLVLLFPYLLAYTGGI